MKKYNLILGGVVSILFFNITLNAQSVTIINDNGNWKGHFLVISHNINSYNSGECVQSGANSKTDNVGTHTPYPFVPAIANVGENNLTATLYSCTPTAMESGRDQVSGSISFKTVKEVHSVKIEKGGRITLSNLYVGGSNNKLSHEVSWSLTVSGGTKETWSKNATNKNTVTVSEKKEISGGITAKSIDVNGSYSTGVMNAVEASSSSSLSGEHYSTLSQSFNSVLKPGEAIYVYAKTTAIKDEATVFYYKDENKDGVSEGPAFAMFPLIHDLLSELVLVDQKY